MGDVDDPVIQDVPLGPQWPTVDPFLFCAHHLDRYPEADGSFGPARSLAGRSIGSDFAGVDGWNMYHGTTVPGFPSHPHRGFETVTYLRDGICDHADSLGATARFRRGDAQWITAGRGIVHSEMFPLVHEDRPNPLHLFQIWLNLPADNKMADPHFTMLWAEDIPVVERTDARGKRTSITLIAGALDGVTPMAPPPDSWAARPEAEVAIWHISMEAGAECELPPVRGDATLRTLYVFEGQGITVGRRALANDTGAVVDATAPVTIAATGSNAEVLMLQGRPIGEPIARYGPFVMNTEAEIQQAFVDYQETGFGGWPWPDDAPHHGADPDRFARHADGRTERHPVRT